MKIYIVGYTYGDFYDYPEDRIIFATTNIEYARKYVQRFDKIRDKWFNYYSDLLEHIDILPDWKIERFDRLNLNHGAFFQEVDIRS